MAVPSFFTETVVLSSWATTVPGSWLEALPALDRASLAASTTAWEVMVAPEIASMPSPRVRGADLPMNWEVNSSSMASWPRPAVSPLASTVMAAMAPFSRVIFTVTSLAKPLAVAVSTSAPAEAGADRALLMASTAAWELMVAPDTLSMPSPRVKGPVLPINWEVKASSMVSWPRPAVSPLASMDSCAMAPASSRVSCTFTSLAKPLAEPPCTAPVRGAVSAGALVSSLAPKVTRGSAVGVWPRATSATQRRASLVAFSTAVEVTVAPDRASKEPPFTASMPTNWSWKDASLARAPKPGVSAKLVSPTAQPVTRPSAPTPRFTATGPL